MQTNSNSVQQQLNVDFADNSEDLVFGPDGRLYVSSAGTQAVLRYNGTTGAFVSGFVAPNSGGLQSPAGLVFGPDGRLYVSSAGTHAILRYDGTTGAFVSTFVAPNSGGLQSPAGLVFGPDGQLYVSSAGTHAVLRYNGTTGAFINTFVAPGSGGLQNPAGLVFGPDRQLYVSSYVSSAETHAVLRYNGTTGAFINTFVAPGSDGLARKIPFAVGKIQVRVTDNHDPGVPIQGATVSAMDGKTTLATGETDTNGAVALEIDLKAISSKGQELFTPKSITVVASKNGFTPITQSTKTVAAIALATIDVRLALAR